MLDSWEDPEDEPRLLAAPWICRGGVSEGMVHVTDVPITLGHPIGFAIQGNDGSLALTGSSSNEPSSPAEEVVLGTGEVASPASREAPFVSSSAAGVGEIAVGRRLRRRLPGQARRRSAVPSTFSLRSWPRAASKTSGAAAHGAAYRDAAHVGRIPGGAVPRKSVRSLKMVREGRRDKEVPRHPSAAKPLHALGPAHRRVPCQTKHSCFDVSMPHSLELTKLWCE